MESSEIDLGFIKFVQDGLQNNSQENTSATVWQSTRSIGPLSSEDNTSFEMNSHWRRDVDAPLCSGKLTPEASDIASQKEVQNTTIVGGKC
jgi:hypothetical protein